MPDRAHLAVTVHGSRREVPSHALAVIADYGLHSDSEEPVSRSALHTQQHDIDEEVALGTEYVVASVTKTAALPSSFTFWQDAK